MTFPSRFLSLLLAATATSLSADRPNIVLIMADDMGYENLSCHGSTLYKTPHIDKLAAEGMRFDNAHSQPLCTPSRVQIMTGIYNNRNYLRFGLLDPKAVTFANILRDAGYDTCIAGKWQLGGSYDAPKALGSDRHCLWQLNRRPSSYNNLAASDLSEELTAIKSSLKDALDLRIADAAKFDAIQSARAKSLRTGDTGGE